MEYKSNLLVIKNIFDNPTAYVHGTGTQPVDPRAEPLLDARRRMKEQMSNITSCMEEL
jgi:hypothetical protein